GCQGGGQRPRRERRPAVHWIQYPTAARAGAKSFLDARADLPIPLLHHAQDASGDARGGGGGVSRKLRHARRVVRSPHAGADAQGPLDPPGLRRPQLLDAGHQFPRTPSRRGDRAGGFAAAALRRGCGGSLARAGQQYPRSGDRRSRALSGETGAFIALAPGTARAARPRAAPAARFYICSLLKIRAIRPIPRTPSAYGLGATPARQLSPRRLAPSFDV